jgi:CubicO group peptidase (beta-lactamase class C family)
MSLNHIPGLALAIIKNGEVEKLDYYGISNFESNIPIDSNSIFEIASMTKQIVSAGILLLQEDGLLSVKDKLSKYIPKLPSTWEDITIEQLMNHTSGLRDDWDESNAYFMKHNSDEKMLTAQIKYPLLFHPGEGFQYSSGPFFLGILIEKITDKHYSFFLKERIFNKLMMFNTSVYDSTSLPKHLVTGYRWNGDKYEAGTDIPTAAESRADVGIITTLGDLIKWNLALNDNRLLNSESLKSMFTAGKLKSGHSIPYGYGWYVYFFRNQLIFEHGGAFRTGFNSRISKFPNSGVEIIILCNKWKANLSDLTYELVSVFDSEFKKISEIQQKGSVSKKRDQEIRKLLNSLSTKTFDSGQLYKHVNMPGFDPNELQEILKGFKTLECIGTRTQFPKPLDIYGAKITEIIYYKVFGDNITYWAFAYENGRLVFASLED